MRVTLNLTVASELPQLPFGVAATAFSNEDDSQLEGQAVTITLVANGTLANCTVAQRAAVGSQKCTVASGKPADAARCQLQLPCMAQFLLKACVGSSCSTQQLGQNATTWAERPWRQQPAPQLLPGRPTYALGDTVTLTSQATGWGPASALVVWGNSLSKKQQVINTVSP